VRASHAASIKDRLEELRDINAGILTVDVHFDLGDIATHWPLVLIADFETREDLAHYQSHPRHRRVTEWMSDGIVANRAVVDFEVSHLN
jgi:hypothetical protein